MNLHWTRPAWDVSTLTGHKPCCTCGALTTVEYATTAQCEPNALTLWRPLCVPCRAQEKAR